MNSMIETQLLKDILANNTLFEVEEIDGKLEYKLDNNGKKIRICEIDEIKFDEIKLSNRKYFEFKKGQNKYIVNYAENNKGDIPMVGSSLNNKCIAYYIIPIDEEDVIYSKCITFNKDNAKGSRAFLRDFPFVMDRHHIAILQTELVDINYSQILIDNILKERNFGWGDNVANAEVVKKLSIKIPKEKELNHTIYSSYKLQQSIAKNIEEKLGSLEYKINILKTMINLKKLEIDNILLNIFEKRPENYILVEDKKVFLKDIIYKPKKLYESKNIEEEFIATKRMGFTLSDDSISEINFVEWLTIDDLNKVEGLYIEQLDTKTKISQEDVYSQYAEDSYKRKPIQLGNILVSFKMTIGVTKIYNSEQTVYCNEAIDIVNICDKEKYDNHYISFLIGNEYKKYTQNNVGSITLNNDLKDLIYLKVPEDIVINDNIIKSIKIQEEIANFLNTSIKKINSNISNLNNLISLLNLTKENTLKQMREHEKSK